MKEQVIQTVRNLLEITIHYIPMAIACFMLNYLIGERQVMLLPGVIFVLVPISFYFIRQKITQPVAYLLMHVGILLIVGIFPFENNVAHYIYAIMTSVYFILSFLLHFQKDDLEKKQAFYEVPILALVIMVVTEYFVAAYMKADVLLPVIASATVLLILGYYLSTYMTHYLRFLRTNRAAVRNLPKDKLLKEGGGITLVFTLASTAILFLCAQANFLDSWFYKVLQYIKRGIVFLLKRILPDELPEDNEILMENYLNEEFNPFEGMASASGPLAEIIEQVVQVLAVIGTVIFVTALVVGIVTAYIRAFHRENPENEIKESIGKQKAEEINKKQDTKQRNLLGFLSPGERIRRIYARLIQSFFAKNREITLKYPVHSMTGRELKVLFPEEKEKVYLELVELYEKARYSPSECTKEDVRKARQLTHQI